MDLWRSLLVNRQGQGSSDPSPLDLRSRAMKNLRLYLQEAILPTLRVADSAPAAPPPGHKAHRNTLTVRPERWRGLENVQLIMSDSFCENVVKFADEWIPRYDLGMSDVDEQSGEELTVPCPRWFGIRQRVIPPVANLERVTRWVQELPLDTLQRIMHLIYPQTSEFTFEQSPVDVDHKLMRCLVWGPPSTDVDRETEIIPAMVVIVQPPWVLSLHDLELFTGCERFPQPQSESHGRNPTYRSKERLWAKVWDICVRQKCRWFVLTMYGGWVFGAFSKGWTRGFVSKVFSFEDKMPTILEGLLYWFASAAGIKGGWMIPEVPEPIQSMERNVSNLIPPPPTYRFPVAPPSESSWGGVSDAPGDNVSVTNHQEVADLLMSPTGVQNLRLPFHEPFQPRQMLLQNVQNWQLGLPYMGAPGNNLSQTPSLASLSDISDTSTVRDFTERDEVCGTWLTSNPLEFRTDVA